MKKYPLMEIKEFLNFAFRARVIVEPKVKVSNYTQYQIVRYLFEHEGVDVYQKDFENALHIRKSTISGILDTMEKNKILVRLSSETDARGKIVKLSSEFEKEKRCIIEEMKKVEETLIRGISEAEMETFYRVLDKMKSNIEKEGVKK